MNQPPSVVGDFKKLPRDAAERREAFVEFLGQHLFSLRNQQMEQIRRRLESPEARRRMGSIQAQPYTAVAALEPETQQAAIELAQTGIDLFLQDLLRLLQNTGPGMRLGKKHALRYRLWMEVIDLAADPEEEPPVVADELINRGTQRVLESYFGRWLNSYAKHV